MIKIVLILVVCGSLTLIVHESISPKKQTFISAKVVRHFQNAQPAIVPSTIGCELAESPEKGTVPQSTNEDYCHMAVQDVLTKSTHPP